jgi:hypothetical protein
MPAEAPQASAAELQTRARVLSDLTKLQNALEALAPLAVSGADVGTLPAPLREKIDGLRSLEELQSFLAKGWRAPPEADALPKHLVNILKATNDAARVTRWQQELAARASQEGHPEVAKKLRDMKLAAAEGEAMNRPFPGLVPEGPAQSVKPGIKEPVGAGLPPLEEDVAATAQRVRTQISNTVGEIRVKYASPAAWHPVQSRQLAAGVREPARHKDDRAEDEPERAVAGILGRSLTPAERSLVSAMSARGKKPADIATVLRGLELPAATK